MEGLCHGDAEERGGRCAVEGTEVSVCTASRCHLLIPRSDNAAAQSRKDPTG